MSPCLRKCCMLHLKLLNFRPCFSLNGSVYDFRGLHAPLTKKIFSFSELKTLNFRLNLNICDSSHRNLPVVGWLNLEITPKEDSKL